MTACARARPSGRRHATTIPQAFEDAISDWRAAGGAGTPWIAVESLYSMDGDRAPLAELIAIADRHDGMLVIDEAHATGVFGPDGRGLGAELEGRANVVTLHTCGKALGVIGALVLAPDTLRDYLVNRCRPFIYATAPSPLTPRWCARLSSSAASMPRGASDCTRSSPLAGRAARDLLRHHRVGIADPAGHRRRGCARDAARRGHAGARLRHPRGAPADGAGGHRAAAAIADAECR